MSLITRQTILFCFAAAYLLTAALCISKGDVIQAVVIIVLAVLLIVLSAVGLPILETKKGTNWAKQIDSKED